MGRIPRSLRPHDRRPKHSRTATRHDQRYRDTESRRSDYLVVSLCIEAPHSKRQCIVHLICAASIKGKAEAKLTSTLSMSRYRIFFTLAISPKSPQRCRIGNGTQPNIFEDRSLFLRLFVRFMDSRFKSHDFIIVRARERACAWCWRACPCPACTTSGINRACDRACPRFRSMALRGARADKMALSKSAASTPADSVKLARFFRRYGFGRMAYTNQHK